MSWKFTVDLHGMDVWEIQTSDLKGYLPLVRLLAIKMRRMTVHLACVHEYIPPSWTFVFMGLWGNLKRLKQTFWWGTQHVTYCRFLGIFYIIRRDIHLQNLGGCKWEPIKLPDSHGLPCINTDTRTPCANARREKSNTVSSCVWFVPLRAERVFFLIL